MTSEIQSFIKNQPSLFAMIPYTADDELDLYELRLYVHYVRRAGDDNFCYEAVATTATHCDMSHHKVRQARASLARKGYITFSSDNTGDTVKISVIPIWEYNRIQIAKKRSLEELVEAQSAQVLPRYSSKIDPLPNVEGLPLPNVEGLPLPNVEDKVDSFEAVTIKDTPLYSALTSSTIVLTATSLKSSSPNGAPPPSQWRAGQVVGWALNGHAGKCVLVAEVNGSDEWMATDLATGAMSPLPTSALMPLDALPAPLASASQARTPIPAAKGKSKVSMKLVDFVANPLEHAILSIWQHKRPTDPIGQDSLTTLDGYYAIVTSRLMDAGVSLSVANAEFVEAFAAWWHEGGMQAGRSLNFPSPEKLPVHFEKWLAEWVKAQEQAAANAQSSQRAQESRQGVLQKMRALGDEAF